MDAKFHGVIAFPVTPTDPQGNFDPKAYRVLIEYLLERGVHGLGILASSGAGVYFTEQERKQIASAAVEIIKGRVPLMVGTAALTTAECVRLTKHAESIGADAAAINPVSYWVLTADEVFQHFEQVANAVSSISICIYNNPRTTQFDILPELAGRLSTLPHIDNIKEISPDLGRIAELKKSSGGKLTVSNGRDAQACEAFIAGADAWQSGIAGVLPEPCVRLFNLVKKDKNYEQARKCAAEFVELCRFFSEKGLIRSEHTALEMMGIKVGKPRPPVRVLESADAEKLKNYLTTLGVIGQGVGARTGRL